MIEYDTSNLPEWMTYKLAGAILGGDKPWSNKTIQRLVRRGKLQDNGQERALKRVSRESLLALHRELSEGDRTSLANVVKPPTKPLVASMAKARRTNTQKTRGSGSSKSLQEKVVGQLYDELREPLRAERPTPKGTRSSQN